MSLALDRIAAAPCRRRLVGFAAGLLLATAVAWHLPPLSSVIWICTCDPARPPDQLADERAITAEEEALATELAAALARIQKLDEVTYKLERDLLLNPAMHQLLVKVARIVPAIADGNAIGFRIYFVGAARKYGLLGLRSGDVISTINGISLAAPERPYGSYRAAIDSEVLEVRGWRGDRPLVRRLLLR